MFASAFLLFNKDYIEYKWRCECKYNKAPNLQEFIL